MSQTPSQDPVDLVQTNNTGHDNTSAECMHSPNPTSTPEDPPATNTERMPTPDLTSTQGDPPAANTKHTPSSSPTPTQEDPPTSHQPEVVTHEPSQDSSTQPRSSPPPVPSSKTDISSEAPTDTQAMPNGQNIQIEQTQLPQDDLGSSKDALETYDWAELEDRFHAEMEECANREEGIQEEFKELLNLFKTYTTTGSVHEEQRAGKRLLTRMTYVQHREKRLEEKRTHYVKVVTAFENALALLSEP